MYRIQRKQKGGSVISLIITLAIIGIAAYLAVQYVPQQIEFSTVGSILSKIEQDHRKTRVRSINELQHSIDNQLNVNEMNDLKDSFEIRQSGGMFVIRVSYERELNLIYAKKQMHYEKTITLR